MDCRAGVALSFGPVSYYLPGAMNSERISIAGRIGSRERSLMNLKQSERYVLVERTTKLGRITQQHYNDDKIRQELRYGRGQL